MCMRTKKEKGEACFKAEQEEREILVLNRVSLLLSVRKILDMHSEYSLHYLITKQLFTLRCILSSIIGCLGYDNLNFA